MHKDGRVRPTLAADLVAKLDLCFERLGLPDDCEIQARIVAAMDVLADRFLEHRDIAEPLSKKPRGSSSGAGRDFCSETALSKLGWKVTDLKRRDLPNAAAEDLSLALLHLSEPLCQIRKCVL